jgi:hypothetical protein
MARAFAIAINKDVVRRILIQHYRPGPGGGLRGSRSSARPRTAYGAATFFVANRF